MEEGRWQYLCMKWESEHWRRKSSSRYHAHVGLNMPSKPFHVQNSCRCFSISSSISSSPPAGCCFPFISLTYIEIFHDKNAIPYSELCTSVPLHSSPSDNSPAFNSMLLLLLRFAFYVVMPERRRRRGRPVRERKALACQLNKAFGRTPDSGGYIIQWLPPCVCCLRLSAFIPSLFTHPPEAKGKRRLYERTAYTITAANTLPATAFPSSGSFVEPTME